ncbi:MAG: hypothetical protein AAFO72_07800 [Pseudomonadota bacterium]
MDRDDAILHYLQDRLDAEDRTSFEQALAEDPALAAEVDVMRAVREEMRTEPQHEKAEEVWNKLSAQMDGMGPAANDNVAPWLGVLKYAAVAAIAVAAWQFTVVPRIGDPQDGFRAASEANAEFVLQVRFVDSATIGGIRDLLGPIGGTITDGPSALGIVQVSFVDAASRDAAREVLTSRSEIVDFLSDN